MYKTHGMARAGKVSPEYRAWSNARNRCRNQNCPKFYNYGGRGITMCDEWADSFEAFYKYIGPRPPGLTLDRIDNNRGYEPGNVRWASYSVQNQNRRTKFSEADYEAWRIMRAMGLKLDQIARIVGVNTGASINKGLRILKRRHPLLHLAIPLDWLK